ncbi:ribokinase [Thermocoleostomius sinensis]|uniref:Ribokinase n=1 Tax=Thermocoleostomius sinensis A174 TaxID=2016057 RepID=A0A9E9C6F6_9CYAN|nr:ribokinase [Thermocoleostomius sinensis]WAL58128.1 ribokinase [Thermocoleostomius sinensis A174]
MSVVVFGSINMDLVVRAPRLPAPGETLMGHSFETVPGGKGANQAVAVARLGIATEMIGRVGHDAFGQTLLQGLQASGVGCNRVLIDQTTHSGVAVISVDDSSENTIIIVPGANGQIDEVDINRLLPVLSQAKVLMLQLEVPLAAVTAAAKAAKAAGVTVLLDPAPARADLPDELYGYVDLITPNQVETSQLVNFPVTDLAAAEKAAAVLHQRGVETVITKLGKRGALCLSREETFEIPVFPVNAVDTVAAGDAFNGGLAAGLAAGMSLKQAATQAAAVAALSVTKAGAQPSLPTKEDLTVFLSNRHSNASKD